VLALLKLNGCGQQKGLGFHQVLITTNPLYIYYGT
jgi:hypothetical protein